MSSPQSRKQEFRSPFRYPGGKTWLVPYINRWLASRKAKPRVFVEPFAGGANIGLTVAFEDLANKVVLVELDENVGAVWTTILNGHGIWLADRILGFKLSAEAVAEELGRARRTVRGRAFQTLLHNRVSRGGILAPGSGLINKGENGKGIGSRWYPDTLSKRIRGIVEIKEKITFVQGNAFDTLEEYRRWTSAVFFIDPPYLGATRNRLYAHSDINHEKLFQMASRLKGDFLMTYDDVDTAWRLAGRYGFKVTTVEMKNTHHTRMKELLIGRSLDWAQ